MKIDTILLEFVIADQNLNCPYTQPQWFHFQDSIQKCKQTRVPEQLYKSKYLETAHRQESG